jgi:uncharacterized membrane protein (UPF0127 family)
MKKLSLIALSALLLAGCIGNRSRSITVTSPDGSRTVTLQVEVADTPTARARGLMERRNLPENEGMLFAFPKAEVQRFWMQNTLIPLDIVYFSEDGTFINTFTMEPCTEDPCPNYASAEPAMYALEVNKGFREDYGIGTGWKLDIKQVKKFVRPE